MPTKLFFKSLLTIFVPHNLPKYDKNGKKAEAEVVPSSSLVYLRLRLRLRFGVEVEVEVGVAI